MYAFLVRQLTCLSLFHACNDMKYVLRRYRQTHSRSRLRHLSEFAAAKKHRCILGMLGAIRTPTQIAVYRYDCIMRVLNLAKIKRRNS